jgi:thymidylate kinase
MKVILEGSDLVGKSTAFRLLKGMVEVQDRLMPFTESIETDRIDYEKLRDSALKNLNSLIVVLVIKDDSILLRRLAARDNPDQYDMKCVEYNRQYRQAASYLSDLKNVVKIEVDGLNKYQKTARIVEEYLRYKGDQPTAEIH